MSIETERRFVIPQNHMPGLLPYQVSHIKQGYLSTAAEHTVRIRTVVRHGEPDRAFLTVKGPKKNGSGKEFEYPVPWTDAEEMMDLCGNQVLSKRRYALDWDRFIIDLDVYTGANEGLVIAEVESEEAARFVAPDEWIEVTRDSHNWSNAALVQRPYKPNKDLYERYLDLYKGGCFLTQDH
jgi:adenylate cyclase